MPTRRLLLAAALAAPALARAEESWSPSRPVTMLVGFAPGGGTDIIARLLAPALQQALGQPIAVENRPGASGTLAALAGSRAAPDGHTVYMSTVSASAVVPPLMTPPPFDIYKDQTPIALAATVPLVAVVPTTSPARDLAGLIAAAKADPGGLNYSSSGVATQQHLAAELLSSAAGIRMTHVPFRGTGQAVNEILAGRIDLAIDTFPTYLPHIRGERVRALATTMPERISWLPDLPTVAESGFPGFDANVWYMLMGPPGLPAPIRERWAAAVGTALAEPVLRPRIEAAGFIPGNGSSAHAAELLRRDAERYAEVIRKAGIRIE
ncbi:tripartite tricarboxylate transporter substrate binding protein [Siccirubricoccus sp. KC 17139]|uniref:Tripartite tricarboxylate transporter substrate binding protein n=1 Tax=Siccirubricoccus soli TaxID=2899147 RepID=A0ABT1D506_9PROT|nr:tripartite tricarboxylate transporter substrate binding protein [Siccirubricoccus soli]MCO6416986.1 tripartite tricarboxylate transporter substrate binding protein [Siccirubricoccus soli]MCP2683121.1 tripartite tricarboxylate transporter substrate binding protein [Siccirubricoccus soli]